MSAASTGFKKELKQLLEKYHVQFCVDVSSSSGDAEVEIGIDGDYFMSVGENGMRSYNL